MFYGGLVSTATKRSSAWPVGGVEVTVFQISTPCAPVSLALVGAGRCGRVHEAEDLLEAVTALDQADGLAPP